MSDRDYILLEYGSLAPDTQLSGQVCPSCKGGRSHERSLSVGRAGAFLWWRCHRASCGKRGKARVSGVGDEPETTDQKRKRERVFKRMPLPLKLKYQLAEQYNIAPETFDVARWSYTPDYDGYGPRVIFPIFSPDGRVRGEQFRSYTGHEPKSFTNVELGEQALSWYRFRKYGKILVIVEDIPSAVRAAESQAMDAVALLGTVLNIDRVLEIREQGYKKVWLALDNDALNQAVKYKKEFGHYLPDVLMVKALDEDIKDMSPEAFTLFVQECTQ